MRPRDIVSAVAAVIVIAGGGLIAWHSYGPGTKPTPAVTQAAVPTTSATPASLPAANAQLLEKSLNSPDRKVQAKALTPEIRDSFLDQGVKLFDKGETVHIVPGTFVPDGDTAVVRAKTSKGVQFVLHLVRAKAGASWLIFDTEETK